MSLTDLKKRISKLLEEDEEFRYFIAAKIGLLEILERFKKYDEKFNEILRELRELRQKSQEHDRKFNEILARLDEHDRKFNEIVARLDEHDRKFNEILARLDEHDRKFNEIVARLDEHDRKFNEIILEIRDIKTTLDRLAVSLEDEGVEVVSYFLEKKYGVKVSLGVLYTDAMEINIYGATDNLCIIGEVAVRLGTAKIKELMKKVKYLNKVSPKYLRDNIILVLYGVKIMPKTVDEARKSHIWVVTATKEFTPLIKISRTEIDNLKV